jgi:hypothetical protein
LMNSQSSKAHQQAVLFSSHQDETSLLTGEATLCAENRNNLETKYRTRREAREKLSMSRE